MAKTVRFIHAADLHLDALNGAVTEDIASHESKRLHEANFIALKRLADLCEQELPDFLLIAGDVYNYENRSARAQLYLRDFCLRLKALNIPVLIVHGNHDPLNSRILSLNWPDNVTVFTEEISSQKVYKNDELVALIQGVSHNSYKEKRNLAKSFTYDYDFADDCLQVGLLHTSCEASGQTYAPCSLTDLQDTGLHYFALGHVHEAKVLSKQPLIQYSGAIQGLHINETGPHGCLLVEAQYKSNDFEFKTKFCPLSPVLWHQLNIELEEDMSFDGLEELISKDLEDVCAYAKYENSELISDIVVRIIFKGQTKLNSELRDSTIIAEFLERIRTNKVYSPKIWIKDIQVLTEDVINRDEQIKREDLYGEFLRLSDNYKQNPEQIFELQQAALNELFGSQRMRNKVSLPTEFELLSMLDDAESICYNLLEND